MKQYQITLKGLKPGEDNYEESTHVISASTDEELQGNITSFIYEFRNIHQYYKIKYTNIKEL
jgi:hypothetical protein